MSIVGILTRCMGLDEWVWAVAGAASLVTFQLIPMSAGLEAVRSGTDVYLFLAGMMLLAELARRGGVFEWVAAYAVRSSGGSRRRLFSIVYGAGIVVTVVLSNDATAVVLTPAVAAAVRRAGCAPLPYLFACAFVANAASFVLPISNPANLVVFANAVPSLGKWLNLFSLASLFSVTGTYAVLYLIFRREWRGELASDIEMPVLSFSGRAAAAGICLTVAALLIASGFGAPLGVITCVCGLLVLAASCARDHAAFSEVVRSVSWTVLLLVAGLFVLVRGLESTGALATARYAVEAMLQWSAPFALLGAAGATAAAANLTNNLPAGLFAGSSVASLHGHDAFRAAVAVGIDLGPNLSVTGSLATLLWLIELRRERIDITAWTFLRVGVAVMPPALVLAAESLLFSYKP